MDEELRRALYLEQLKLFGKLLLSRENAEWLAAREPVGSLARRGLCWLGLSFGSMPPREHTSMPPGANATARMITRIAKALCEIEGDLPITALCYNASTRERDIPAWQFRIARVEDAIKAIEKAGFSVVVDHHTSMPPHDRG